jgi:DNA-directed RNA polymerase specialized sigma54-like protein
MMILEAKSVKIARRTIAKYRQELHIAPASRRKRLFSH